MVIGGQRQLIAIIPTQIPQHIADCIQPASPQEPAGFFIKTKEEQHENGNRTKNNSLVTHYYQHSPGRVFIWSTQRICLWRIGLEMGHVPPCSFERSLDVERALVEKAVEEKESHFCLKINVVGRL